MLQKKHYCQHAASLTNKYMQINSCYKALTLPLRKKQPQIPNSEQITAVPDGTGICCLSMHDGGFCQETKPHIFKCKQWYSSSSEKKSPNSDSCNSIFNQNTVLEFANILQNIQNGKEQQNILPFLCQNSAMTRLDNIKTSIFLVHYLFILIHPKAVIFFEHNLVVVKV